MAVTRHSTGSSRPRIFAVIDSSPRPAGGRKRKTGTTKSRVTGGRVTKTPAHHRRKPGMKDKVQGLGKKAAGTLERKPGKKAAGTSQMRGHDGKKKKHAVARK